MSDEMRRTACHDSRGEETRGRRCARRRRTAGFHAALMTGLAAAFFLAGCGLLAPRPCDGDEPIVAVLPFVVKGQEENADRLGRAFAESLANGLGQVEALTLLEVPATTAPGDDDSRRADLPGPVGATRLLTGMLTRDGEAVHVSLRLLDAEDRTSLWETEVDSDRGDLTGLVSILTRRAAQGMNVPYPDLYDYIGNVTGGPSMSGSPLAARVSAAWQRRDFDEYLEGSSELVEEFGDDPAAHVLNAWALTLAWDANPSSDTLARLKDRLITLDGVDPASPYDELLRAFVYRSSAEPDQARVVYSQVLARTDLTHTLRAWALRQRSLTNLQIGNAAAARRDAEEAVGFDPSNALSLMALSKALEVEGRLEDSIARSKEALALEPLQWRHHQRLGIVYSRAGRFDDAALALDQACRLGESQEACANLAVTLQRAGRGDDARAAAEHARSLVGTRWGFYNLACFWALAGKTTKALDDLSQSVNLGFADALITTDPDLESLRSDSRFEAIVAEVEESIRSRRQLSGSIFPWQG